MELSVKPRSFRNTETEQSEDEINTDRSLFRKPLLSSFSSSVLLCDTESNLFTWHSLGNIAELGRLEAVNCIYQLKELTTCQVG